MQPYELLVVSFNGKIFPLGYINKNDHEKAIEIFLKNKKILSPRDISLIIFQTLRKIPKKNLVRIKHKNKHMFYLTHEDYERWKEFLKNSPNNIETTKKNFLKTFKFVDIDLILEEKEKEVSLIIKELEKIKEKLKNIQTYL